MSLVHGRCSHMADLDGVPCSLFQLDPAAAAGDVWAVNQDIAVCALSSLSPLLPHSIFLLQM